MGSLEYRPRADNPPLDFDDRFEVLRDAFQERLQRDRRDLRRLSAELSRASGDTAAVFEEIQMLAHRIAGAAALFEDHDVRNAAGGLELAAHVALRRRAGSDDDLVWGAVRTLLLLLPA